MVQDESRTAVCGNELVLVILFFTFSSPPNILKEKISLLFVSFLVPFLFNLCQEGGVYLSVWLFLLFCLTFSEKNSKCCEWSLIQFSKKWLIIQEQIIKFW